MPLKRRDFLVAGAVLLGVFGGIPALRRLDSSFDFEPIEELTGFRRLGSGPLSAGPVVFLGLESGDNNLSVEYAEILQNPCASLFGDQSPQDDRLPIAIFTDYNCPYCAVLSDRLIRLEESGAPVRLIWYETPLLGPRSERSADAALAADLQGSYIAAHRYLMAKTLPPGPNGLARMAQELKLDPDQLIADANGGVVAARLRRARAMGRAFGVIGTPTTVVGRTVVTGSITARRLDQLMTLEQSDPILPCA